MPVLNASGLSYRTHVLSFRPCTVTPPLFLFRIVYTRPAVVCLMFKVIVLRLMFGSWNSLGTQNLLYYTLHVYTRDTDIYYIFEGFSMLKNKIKYVCIF